MGKIIETRKTIFGRGMTNFLRSKDFDYARLISNFDIYSDPTLMSPYRDMTADIFAGSFAASTAQLCKFLAGPTEANDATVQYALGVVSGTTRAKIFAKSTAAGGNWNEATAGGDSNTGRNENLFVIYRDVIYGARNDSHIWSYAPLTQTFTTAAQALTYTQIFQGLVHSKDDILYIPYYSSSGSFIASFNGSIWNNTALTLPKDLIPISITEYGNYLAIACKPRRILSRTSVVYLWDRNATLETLSESINWGPESLEMIEEIDGELVGVSFYANTTSEAITLNSKMIFKSYSGGPPRARQFLEIPLTSAIVNNNELPTANNTDGVALTKQKINNRILFFASVEVNNTRHDAIWAVARLADGQLSVSIDRRINNDTALTSGEPKGFFKFGDYIVAGFENNGTYTVNVTINATTFSSQTSVYETLIFGESYLKFKLKSIGVMTAPMPANGQVVLKYRKDEETSNTTIFTNTTDNSLFHESINIESSGAALPQFRELTLRIESTGGAEVTGFWAQAEEISDGLVNKFLKVIRGWFA